MRLHSLKGKIRVGFYALLLCSLLSLTNYVAGAFLFMTFRENPAKAGFFTIEQAWLQDANGQAQKRIIGSAFIAALLCLGVPFALVMTYRNRESNLFGKARFANSSDIKSEGLNASKGLLLGKFDGDLLCLGGYEFVLLAAPTRTGKGVGFVIPNLLTFPDSAVVLDIKGENYNLTSEFRHRYTDNAIYYFNPFSETTHRWNPLSYVSSDPHFRVSDLLALGAIIYPTNEKEPFWPDSAKNLFIGIALLVLETPALPKTFGEILRQGSGKGQPVEDYLRHIIAVRAASDMPLSSACTDSLNRFLNNAETTLKSILASFIAPLSMWGNAVIDKATSADDFDLREVRKKKMTVYLHIPASEILQAGFILNLFFSQLINENVKVLPEENPDLKYQCLLLMDEFTAIGKVAIIAKGVGYMAGYNLRLAIIIQDKNQLESTYGKEDANNIVSNMGAVIYFTPSQVKEAEEYSKMIGYDTVKSSSLQHANIGAMNKGSYSRSSTETHHSRALMLPQELLAMSKQSELVVRPGIPVIKADKIFYYKDKFFNERFTAVPMRDVTIGTEKRQLPLPHALPPLHWRSFKTSLLASDYYLVGDYSDLSDC